MGSKPAKKPALKSEKKAAKASAAKESVKSAKKPAKLSPTDHRLMSLAADRYEKLFSKISQQGHRLNAERKLALEIGQRVLQKVKFVQEGLSLAARGTASIDLSLLNFLRTKKAKAKAVKKARQSSEV